VPSPELGYAMVVTEVGTEPASDLKFTVVPVPTGLWKRSTSVTSQLAVTSAGGFTAAYVEIFTGLQFRVKPLFVALAPRRPMFGLCPPSCPATRVAFPVKFPITGPADTLAVTNPFASVVALGRTVVPEGGLVNEKLTLIPGTG